MHFGPLVEWLSGRVVLHPYTSDITGGRCIHGSIVLTLFTNFLLYVVVSFCLVAWVTEVVGNRALAPSRCLLILLVVCFFGFAVCYAGLVVGNKLGHGGCSIAIEWQC